LHFYPPVARGYYYFILSGLLHFYPPGCTGLLLFYPFRIVAFLSPRLHRGLLLFYPFRIIAFCILTYKKYFTIKMSEIKIALYLCAEIKKEDVFKSL